MSYTSTLDDADPRAPRGRRGLRPGWTPLTIALMVIGFIIAWPLGLAMLAYILWGDRLPEMGRRLRSQIDPSVFGNRAGPGFGATTGNSAFDAYRDRELARLEEERRRIDAMRADFDAFLRELREKKDQEEFDRFMAARGHARREPGAPE